MRRWFGDDLVVECLTKNEQPTAIRSLRQVTQDVQAKRSIHGRASFRAVEALSFERAAAGIRPIVLLIRSEPRAVSGRS
jgi:hypothetical protein